MTVAYETKDREDEHSCFSDNTNADVVNNIKGVRMVYLGEFPGVSGPGLTSLVAAVDPELDATLREQLDATLAQAEAFPDTVRGDDRRRRRFARAHGHARASSPRSRSRARPSPRSPRRSASRSTSRSDRSRRALAGRGPCASSRPCSAAAASLGWTATAPAGPPRRRSRPTIGPDSAGRPGRCSGRRGHGVRQSATAFSLPLRDAAGRGPPRLRRRQQLLQRQLGDRAGLHDRPRRPRADVQRPVLLVLPLQGRPGPAARRRRRPRARAAACASACPGPTGGPSRCPATATSSRTGRSTACRPRADDQHHAMRSGRARSPTARPTRSRRRPTRSSSRPSALCPPDVQISPRIAPAVFGVGLLEAVPEADVARRAPTRTTPTATASRVGPTGWPTCATGGTSLGRFGWKANVPTVEQQNAGAFNGDIGITIVALPRRELPARAARLRGGAQRRDARARRRQAATASPSTPARWPCPPAATSVPPTRATGERAVRRARAARRATCPELTTGDRPTWPRSSNQVIRPYTDLLLHDMGPGLADGRPDGEATGSEWRTAPLWGIGLTETVSRHTRFLHDGRARNLTRGHPVARRRGRGRRRRVPVTAARRIEPPSSPSWSRCEASALGRRRVAARRAAPVGCASSDGGSATTQLGSPSTTSTCAAVADDVIVPRYERFATEAAELDTGDRRALRRSQARRARGRPEPVGSDARRPGDRRWPSASVRPWSCGRCPRSTSRPSAEKVAGSRRRHRARHRRRRRRPRRQRPRARHDRAAALRSRLRRPDRTDPAPAACEYAAAASALVVDAAAERRGRLDRRAPTRTGTTFVADEPMAR